MFDIGLRAVAGQFMRRENLSPVEIVAMLPWLRKKNSQREHIYIRPAGERHPLVLLDDLEVEGLEKLRADGLEPAVLVETSRGNHQVWLRHIEDLGPEERRRVAVYLAERYDGDRSSTDSSHFGRLAGFTNPKPEYQDEGGAAPFVLLRSSSGKTTTVPIPEHPPAERSGAGLSSPRGGRADSLASYHEDPRFKGDLHRADLAWACQVARVGWSREKIVEELLESRDLSKKGTEKRQREYAERTAAKAMAVANR